MKPTMARGAMTRLILVTFLCMVVLRFSMNGFSGDRFQVEQQRMFQVVVELEPKIETVPKPLWYVRDLVTLPPEDEFLSIIGGATFDHTQFTLKDSHCDLQFVGGRTLRSPVLGIDSITGEDTGYVRCKLPEKFDTAAAVKSTRLHLAMRQNEGSIVIEAEERGQLQLLDGKRLVYEALSRDELKEVVLFTKGIANREADETSFVGTKCVFYKEDPELYVESELVGLSKEVFRCRQPVINEAGAKTRVSLKLVNGEVLASVAVYQPVPSREGKKKTLCACTMVRNVAKFLPEWTAYHAHLGVEAFYLYDNNSDDETAAEAGDLASTEVHRRPWPWAKTQESGFAHCAVAARNDCQWMAFVDVDEFVFPFSWLRRGDSGGPNESAPLMQVIDSVNGRQSGDSGVGQLNFMCRNFGPSGLATHPAEGVTRGYTCRERALQRHKSIVRLSAVSPSLTNVIHHFELLPSFRTVAVPPKSGVINHYKYQAWEVFRSKFKRRASASVVDWTERKNLGSRDRTRGLGVKDEKPGNWESQFCEVQDVELKNYVLSVFGSELPWKR